MKTERISIVPFEMKYLEAYFNGFDEEITKYQWPDPFESIEDAESMLQEFLNEMNRGETLLFSILSNSGEFLGSVEVHGLTGDCPELGIWIMKSEQNKGYAYEALNVVLDDVRTKYHLAEFYYETDVCNMGSIKLLHKLQDQYEIIERGLENAITDSGKELTLQGYLLRAKEAAPA